MSRSVLYNFINTYSFVCCIYVLCIYLLPIFSYSLYVWMWQDRRWLTKLAEDHDDDDHGRGIFLKPKCIFGTPLRAARVPWFMVQEENKLFFLNITFMLKYQTNSCLTDIAGVLAIFEYIYIHLSKNIKLLNI